MSGTLRPDVTVIVPIFNRAESIAQCLDSLVALNYPQDRFEIVAVDNGSSDGSVQVVQEAMDRNPGRIRLIRESTRGPSAARNAGIRDCTTEIVAFTDSDCAVDPAWLSAVIAPLADPAVGASGGRILAFPDDGMIAQFGERIHDHQKALQVLWPGYAITINFATRRDVLADIGLFDETMLRCEDVELALRVRAGGYALRYVHEAAVYHRNRKTLRELAREGFLHGRFLAKHGPRLAALSASIGPRPATIPARPPRRDYTRSLPIWAEKLLDVWFRGAKVVGRLDAAVNR